MGSLQVIAEVTFSELRSQLKRTRRPNREILARLVGLKEFKRTPAGGAAAQLEVNPHIRAGHKRALKGKDG